MFEKVNPGHPDKLADRIAGALVDLAYKAQKEPKIAVEVLLGHGECHIVAESSVVMNVREVWSAVDRIVGHHVFTDYRELPQDVRLRENQAGGIRCGDNGIFRGAPVTDEQKRLVGISRQRLYNFEAGKTRVPFSDLLKIVVMGLNSSLDEFVREEYNGESVKF